MVKSIDLDNQFVGIDKNSHCKNAGCRIYLMKRDLKETKKNWSFHLWKNDSKFYIVYKYILLACKQQKHHCKFASEDIYHNGIFRLLPYIA